MYDNGRAYCAFHESFKDHFKAVFDEWLEAKQIADPSQIYFTEGPIVDDGLRNESDSERTSVRESEEDASFRTSPRTSASAAASTAASAGPPHYIPEIPARFAPSNSQQSSDPKPPHNQTPEKPKKWWQRSVFLCFAG